MVYFILDLINELNFMVVMVWVCKFSLLTSKNRLYTNGIWNIVSFV